LNLVRPESPLAAGGLLDPAVIPEMPGATFTVNYPGMLPLDQVQLLVSGVGSHASATQTVSRPGALTFAVPRSVILASLLKTVRVYYTMTRNGQPPQHSAQLDVLVNPPLMVDQRLMVLNGLSVRYAPWPRVADSIGNSFTRAAVGGSGPYQYVSSNTNVASVSSTGKVVGNGNGLATITITDKLNNRVSYQVRVSNVWRLNYVTHRPWTWKNAVQWMNSLGGRPADGAVINDLHLAYGRPLRLERYIWNCVMVNHDAGEFYHHAYASSHGRAIANTPNTQIFGGLCITALNG
jgi:hypothetical protein